MTTTDDDRAERDGAARWTVYMVVNPAGRSYVGTTTDLERRLRQHDGLLAGGARATRGKGPWRVVHQEPDLPDRATAQAREHALKKDRKLRRRLLEGSPP